MAWILMVAVHVDLVDAEEEAILRVGVKPAAGSI